MGNTFLKWAGGKRWFVNSEYKRFPLKYNRYIEPFLGGGAVFFYLEPQNAILSDINRELIDTYIAVRDELDSVYKNLKIHQKKHCKEYFYTMRNKKTRKTATAAARMIYLNKSCFNGIYRVNSQGKFNVPLGTIKDMSFERDNLLQASEILKKAKILCQDFQITIDAAQTNDFLFCDPPYAVENEDSRFVSYTADLFSWEDQVRLAKALERAKNRGVKIIMTNVDHPTVRALYEEIGGFSLDTVSRNCFISGTLEGRKAYDELIVSANI